MRTLEKLTIKGFKSIREQTLELKSLNVFIGGNGVGKSNLIGVFSFLQAIVEQKLAKYTAYVVARTMFYTLAGRRPESCFSILVSKMETKRCSIRSACRERILVNLLWSKTTTAWASDGTGDGPFATENVAYWKRESGSQRQRRILGKENSRVVARL